MPSAYELLQEHSPLGPSASLRWLKCPGSVKLTEGMPDTESIFAAEGTFAHYVSELARVQEKPAEEFIDMASECGRFVVDKAFADALQSFIDYVNALPGDPFYEHRVSYDVWVPGGFGTADDIRMADTMCHVTDLKFGQGVKIFAEDNSQLMLYALGVFQDLGHLYDIDFFHLVIHQPRLDHVDEVTVPVQEILIWAERVVKPIVNEALANNAHFEAGDWCRWCPAKATCAHRAKWVFANLVEEMDDLDGPTLTEAGLMDLDTLGKAMDLVDLVRVWCTDIEAHVMSEVQKGHDVGGWKIVEGRSNRTWKDDAEAEKAMRAAKLKVAEIFTRKMISPTAFEKLRGKKHAILTTHVEKPRGKPKLAPPSDPRPPLKVSPEEMTNLEEDSASNDD
jgi:hypothetical protein